MKKRLHLYRILESFITSTSFSEPERKQLTKSLLPKHETRMDKIGNLIVGNKNESGNIYLDAHIDTLPAYYREDGGEVPKEADKILSWYTKKGRLSGAVLGKLSGLPRYFPSYIEDRRTAGLIKYLKENDFENGLDSALLENLNSRIRKIGCFVPYALMGYLDNNVGCAIVTAILDDFRQDGIVGVYTTQEETGLKGARYFSKISKELDKKANIIVFDVMPAEADREIKIGRGPVLREAMSSKILVEELTILSKRNDIPLQTSNVFSASNALVYLERGLNCMYYPVPVTNNIHTVFGTSVFEDIYNSYLLTCSIIERII